MTACSPKTEQPAVEASVVESTGLIAEGSLLPANSLDQSFSIAGKVSEVLVEDGEAVEAGQVLARLAVAPDAQTALARARQEVLSARQTLDSLNAAADVTLAQGKLAVFTARDALDAAQEDYDADETEENLLRLDEAAAILKQSEDVLKNLEEGAGIDLDQLAAAGARLESTEAALASAQALVDAHELKSSLAGTITNITLQAGQKVAAGQVVFTIADFTSWAVKTDNLTEMDVVNVEVGQKVSVLLDALPGQSLSGEVTHINLFSEEKRGDTTYTVSVVLDESVPQMRWGMTAAVQFNP
jgi:multidrug resistance efflux pump